MLCSGRFAGDRTTFPADPPPGHRDRVSRAGGGGAARRLRWRRHSTSHEEASGTYDVKVTEASFPSLQRLGQTSVLQLGIRNTGKRTVPGLTVSFTIKGQRGEDSSLPFGVSDPQPELAQPDRPVWVLSATYPRLRRLLRPRRRLDLEPEDLRLRPAQARRDDQGRLEAERGPGRRVHAPLRRRRRASEARPRQGPKAASAPGGSFATEISDRLPETEVTDSGEIVEIEKGK